MGDVPTASCACRSELRAGAASAAVQGTRGPFLLPAPGLQPTSLGCPSPTAVEKASNATSCEDPAHHAPPTHCLGLPKEILYCAQSARTPCPGPANLPLTFTVAPTLQPSAPPFLYRPRPSLEKSVHNFLLPQNGAQPPLLRTLQAAPEPQHTPPPPTTTPRPGTAVPGWFALKDVRTCQLTAREACWMKAAQALKPCGLEKSGGCGKVILRTN